MKRDLQIRKATCKYEKRPVYMSHRAQVGKSKTTVLKISTPVSKEGNLLVYNQKRDVYFMIAPQQCAHHFVFINLILSLSISFCLYQSHFLHQSHFVFINLILCLSIPFSMSGKARYLHHHHSTATVCAFLCDDQSLFV